MVWVILGITGSIMFAVERYRYWKPVTNSRSKLFLKAIGAGLGLLAILALILFLAYSPNLI